MKRGTYAAWLRMAKFETLDWDDAKWQGTFILDTYHALEGGDPVSADKFFEFFCVQATIPNTTTDKVEIDFRLTYHRTLYEDLKQFLAQPDQMETAHCGHNGDHDGLRESV